jgi:hypothetical protein
MSANQADTTVASAFRPANELVFFIGPPATPSELVDYCTAARRQEIRGDPSRAIELNECRQCLLRTLLDEVDGARAPLMELLERIVGEPVGSIHALVEKGIVRGERCPVLRIDLTDTTLATGLPIFSRLGDSEVDSLAAALRSACGAKWVEITEPVTEH